MRLQATNTKRPRLFFVIPTLKGGGAERVLIALANHFNQLNCASTIIALNAGKPAYVIDNGLEVHYLTDRRSDSISHRLYYQVVTFYKLVYLIMKHKPDCVLSFITSANIWTGVACNITHTPYVVSERTNPDRSLGKLNHLSQLLAARLYKKALAVVVGAKGVGDRICAKKGFSDLKNIIKITNAIPMFNIPSKQRVHHRKFILGVGRLEYVKGFDLLLTAFGHAQLPDTDLIIVGEGPEREELTAKIHNMGLGKQVYLPGAKTNLQDYYSQAELFVLPSRNEGYPNALIEAMSFGCACIAMNCEFGPSEIISHGYNGLVGKTGKIYELTDAVKRLLNDTLLKNEIAFNAASIADTNSNSNICRQWEALLLKQVYTPLTNSRKAEPDKPAPVA